MCWSAEVSLQTFITTVIGLTIAYHLNYDIFVIALVFSFVFIQLIEYFIWTYIKYPRITNRKTK